MILLALFDQTAKMILQAQVFLLLPNIVNCIVGLCAQ